MKGERDKGQGNKRRGEKKGRWGGRRGGSEEMRAGDRRNVGGQVIEERGARGWNGREKR